MGHSIQYFAAVPDSAGRGWLDRLTGFYDPEEVMPADWEGELRTGGFFMATLTPTACQFRLVMNYSGLFAGNPAAVAFARRFEAEFWEACGAIGLLRVDQFLVGEWTQAVGREWWEIPQPVDTLRAWLKRYESHWHWLPPEPGRPEQPTGREAASAANINPGESTRLPGTMVTLRPTITVQTFRPAPCGLKAMGAGCRMARFILLLAIGVLALLAGPLRPADDAPASRLPAGARLRVVAVPGASDRAATDAARALDVVFNGTGPTRKTRVIVCEFPLTGLVLAFATPRDLKTMELLLGTCCEP